MNRKSNRGPFDTDKGYSRQCPACDWKVTQPNDGGGPKRANDLFAEHAKTHEKPREDPNFDYTDLSTPMMKGDYLKLVESIFPDWRQIWTPERAEYNLKGFKFKGPGWYLTDDDSVLVLPSHKEGSFLFWVYNNRNPAESFAQAVNSPVRVDERGEGRKRKRKP